MKSSGEYPVKLVAMMLQKNANSNVPELVCLFSTITNDIFSYRFRKNNKYDMFTQITILHLKLKIKLILVNALCYSSLVAILVYLESLI